MVDVHALREQAALRAARRPRPPFRGAIQDRHIEGVRVRVYQPAARRRPATIHFAHGGYGILGDLELQDGYCRLLSGRLGCRVVSVDYRLAPEYTFEQAVEDMVTTVTHDPAHEVPVLCGDSAGGAVVTAAAARVPGCAALILTNPNLDLTLRSLDPTSRHGPDPQVLHQAFAQWVRPASLLDAPQLQEPERRPPPTLLTVGSMDSLLTEARTFAATCHGQDWPVELLELQDTGHGFISDVARAGAVMDAIELFLDAHVPGSLF